MRKRTQTPPKVNEPPTVIVMRDQIHALAESSHPLAPKCGKQRNAACTLLPPRGSIVVRLAAGRCLEFAQVDFLELLFEHLAGLKFHDSAARDDDFALRLVRVATDA